MGNAPPAKTMTAALTPDPYDGHNVMARSGQVAIRYECESFKDAVRRSELMDGNPNLPWREQVAAIMSRVSVRQLDRVVAPSLFTHSSVSSFAFTIGGDKCTQNKESKWDLEGDKELYDEML